MWICDCIHLIFDSNVLYVSGFTSLETDSTCSLHIILRYKVHFLFKDFLIGI